MSVLKPVVVIGDGIIDAVQTSDAPPVLYPGGAALNLAVGLARLGLPSGLAARIGLDRNGFRLMRYLREEGVGLINTPNADFTGVATSQRRGGVFNSDEKPEVERQILNRVWRLRCEGLILVPVSGSSNASLRDFEGRRVPTVLFGRTVDDVGPDAVTIDNFSASLSGHQLSDRPRPRSDRRDNGPSASEHRARPLRRHEGGDERQESRARSPLRAIGGVPRGGRLFGRTRHV
jgi:hypothetical protein